jgi:enoyl-CoA hydratase/carnithine racemase
MKILLSGEPVSAPQAREYGILSTMSERGKALPDALNLAEKIASKSTSAILLAKEAVQRGKSLNFPDTAAPNRMG